MTRWGRRLAAVALVALLVGGGTAVGWWAASVTLAAKSDVAQLPDEPVWAEATLGSVGRTLQYATTLRQPVVPLAFNALGGVVTAASAGEVQAGEVLYVVGATPVRAVLLERPMWRDLARGASGDDVSALQELLLFLGHLSGTADGVFGARTETAVRAWQKAEGRERTGVVRRGEMVAFPRLPIHVTLGTEITVGRVLVGGEEAVLTPTGDREFVIMLSDDQVALVPAEASVEVAYEGHLWSAQIAAIRQDAGGQTALELVGVDGGEVCGDECDVLPLDERVTLRSQVIVVPRVEGVAVPAAAVLTAPDGATSVVTDSGEVEVSVLGSGQGMVIVEGIRVGTRVRIGEAAPDHEADPDQED